MVELDRALSVLQCRHMLVVLDCCFAGAFRWASFRHPALAPQRLHRKRYQWLIHDEAWQAIASAAHDQKALEVASEQPLGALRGSGLVAVQFWPVHRREISRRRRTADWR